MSSLGRSIKSIGEYLMGARLVDPLGKEIYPHLFQRWRQSLFRTLGEIAEEHWQIVIEPDGARPPLSPKEIRHELEQCRAKYPFDAGTVMEQDALNRACALRALDAIVWEMQHGYDQICQAYAELRDSLQSDGLYVQSRKYT